MRRISGRAARDCENVERRTRGQGYWAIAWGGFEPSGRSYRGLAPAANQRTDSRQASDSKGADHAPCAGAPIRSDNPRGGGGVQTVQTYRLELLTPLPPRMGPIPFVLVLPPASVTLVQVLVLDAW